MQNYKHKELAVTQTGKSVPEMLEDLKNRFTYRDPKEYQTRKHAVIRLNALSFASVINEMCPDSRERSLAITALEEAAMWANASIARNE